MTKQTAAFVTIILAIGLAMAGCAAFDLGDIIQVDTPRELQESHGLAARMSLNDARDEYQAWFDDTKRNGNQWKGEIERGEEMKVLFSALTLEGLNDLGPSVFGVPITGPGGFVLSNLITYFFGRSGRRKDKEDSYNAGAKRTTDTIITALNAAGKDKGAT